MPDILVELSRRHPDWDLTRALDFPGREPLAYQAGRQMDAIIFTRQFNPEGDPALVDYSGPLRTQDRHWMLQTEDLPFGDWALGALEREEPGQRQAQVCKIGPFGRLSWIASPNDCQEWNERSSYLNTRAPPLRP